MGMAAALLLAGCSGASSASSTSDDGRIRVTASTNAYGQIASAIGGDAVDVTSIINRPSDDPHEFEASATDQLSVNRAQLIIQNGAGYDPFMQQLLGARPKPAVPVLTAATLAADWPGGGADATPEGFNEHVFYDLATMKTLAARIATDLGEIKPADKSTFAANLTTLTARIEGLQKQQSALETAHGGAKIFVTEPLPLYLAEGAGLVNVTPDAFSEAVEAGNDVPPSTMLQANRLLASGDVKVLIANAQAGGPETTAVIAEAKKHDIAVLEWMETLPTGLTYTEWMQRNLDQLKAALG
jgi:zinc/manganese transport system substrate-binding protein